MYDSHSGAAEEENGHIKPYDSQKDIHLSRNKLFFYITFCLKVHICHVDGS